MTHQKVQAEAYGKRGEADERGSWEADNQEHAYER